MSNSEDTIVEEIKDSIEDLLRYFEMGEGATAGEWPMIAVWGQGHWHQGVISDELYDILVRFQEIRAIQREEDGETD